MSTENLDNPCTQSNDFDESRFFVVGIGASAGGLQALEEFFENIPKDIDAAFVVIQHLSPRFKSLMQELLQRKTAFDVYQGEGAGEEGGKEEIHRKETSLHYPGH